LFNSDILIHNNIVVVAAKSTSDASVAKPFPPDPDSSQSTISTVEREIREAGGEAYAIAVDVRDVDSVQRLVDGTVGASNMFFSTAHAVHSVFEVMTESFVVLQKYGRLDVLVYNSGAIWWSSVENTPTKRFQLMQRVNPEGLYATVQAVLPYFKGNGWNGRIIVVSPPIYSRFFRGKTAYAMGKVGMSVLTKGLAVDFEREGRTGMAISSIWPAVVRFL
jgi:NAD(P)-dependent dehydrogenase (short-subunit alcohol dehydrogenase family)